MTLYQGHMTAAQKTCLLQNGIIACSVDEQSMQEDEELIKASGFFQPTLFFGTGNLPEYGRCQLPEDMCLLSLKGARWTPCTGV